MAKRRKPRTTRTPKKQVAQEAPQASTFDEVGEVLNPRQEEFCRYYSQGEGTFGNATLSYAAAYEIDIGDTSIRDKDGNPVAHKLYPQTYHTCSSNGSRLLRYAKVQVRIRQLLNDLLKDEIVDAELAKVIKQDDERPSKIAAIREFNKLRGRIIDKMQDLSRLPFGQMDLGEVISTLPQERQDYFYGVISELIKEAELSRSAGPAQSSSTGEA